MHSKLANATCLADLPFNAFETMNQIVYVLDKNWNFVYVNHRVAENLGMRGAALAGKNMWVQFPELLLDAAFIKIKTLTEQGQVIDLVTTSPLTGKRLNIKSFILSDCVVFFSTILINKDELLSELRGAIRKQQ
jgi:PAS domain-containing protein